MEKQIINVNVCDYSMSPGPRYCSQGADSGEDFYHQVLNPTFFDAISKNSEINLNLDGADGYASSFLDEAFGNLVYDFGKELVAKIIHIISTEEPEWINMIENETYNQWEGRRLKHNAPKKTAEHEKWYRDCGGELEKDIWITKQN